MKNFIYRRHLGLLVFSSGLFPAMIHAQTTFASGIRFDTVGGASIIPWQSVPVTGGSEIRYNVGHETYGGMYLYSGKDETSTGGLDGGVSLWGTPVSVVLYSEEGANLYPYNDFNADRGSFTVWKGSKYLGSPSTSSPMFKIDNPGNSATFDSVAVAVNNGSLKVAGSPVITNSTAPTIIGGLGFLKNSDVDAALNLATPPTSTAWKTAYVSRGNVTPLPGHTDGGLLALGLNGTSVASGSNSIASGERTTASGMMAIALGTDNNATADFSTAIGQNARASGAFSFAIGNGVTASGNHAMASGNASTASAVYSIASGSVCQAVANGALARGFTVVASGNFSSAIGWGVTATAQAETVVGSYNSLSTPASSAEVNDLNGIFRVGNGSSTTRSDAVAVLRSGQTTLTNKAWKDNPAVEPTTGNSNAEALVVAGNTRLLGNTRLSGKVIIEQPQGDISMGDYQ